VIELNYVRRKFQGSKVVRNTVAMMAGGSVRTLFQAAYFILLARSLGPGQYGAFIGAVSLIAVLTPFSVWGTDGILIRNVARQQETFPQSWGNALWMTCVFGLVLLAVVLLLLHLILLNRVPLALVFWVGLSDLVLAGVVNLAGMAFLAFEMLGRTAQIGALLTGVRAICALVMLLFVPHPSATSWAILYFCSTAICAIYACMAVVGRLGYPRLSLVSLKADLREGFYFSLGLSSQSIYNNIDKTMLVRLATLEAAGIYSTAYRIIDLGLQPISSVLYSTFARFFQHGAQGIDETFRYAKRFLPFGVGYGILAGVTLCVTAPLLPIVVGRSFNGADEALRWLSPLILIRTIHYFLSNALTGADLQGLRSVIQVAVAALNVLLNIWLIPLYSWRGAAGASLASDGMLAVGMAFAIFVLSRRAKPSKVACGAELRIVP
jgi:O-antigen/teichoic acid export membrane protein